MSAADKIAEAHRSDEQMLLKAGCPWCGQTENLRFRSVGSLTSDMPARPYKVVCMNGDCEDVSGPIAYGKIGAARAWNRRAALADLADAQAQEIERLQRHRVPAEWYADANGQRNAAEAERDRLRGCFEQIEEAALNGCLTPALVAQITRAALGGTP